MTMEYIRHHYDQRFKRGARVQVRLHGDLYAGTVVGSYGANLRVRVGFPGEKALIFHPNEVKIIADEVQP